PKELVSEVKAFSRDQGCTLFMTLFAAYSSVLHRYSQQVDFGVGTFLGNRGEGEWNSVVGFFANTVVLRCDFRGAPTFRQVLERSRSVVTGAIEHQDLPYEEIVRACRVSRGTGRDPLIRATIELATGLVAQVDTSDLRWRLLVSPDGSVEGTAKFDVGLSMIEIGEQFQCKLEYDPAIFARDFMERFVGHFRTLLAAAVAAPDTRVDDLPVLTAEEEARLLRGWNQTREDFQRDKCVHELFEAQARRTPDAVAVRFGDQQLTFRELDERANQLAHYLSKRGVGADTLVGLSIARSPEMAIGILGILKAGGAYLPIDPSYPRARVEFLRRDSGAAWTLTTKAEGPDDLGLDDVLAAIAHEPVSAVENVARPKNLVYVIYTSGSTGKPKGVSITHEGLVNYLSWAVKAYDVARGTGAPVHSSLSFDLTVTSLWAPWLAGRTATLLPESAGVDGLEAALSADASEAPFSLVKLTPAHLNVLNSRLSAGGATGSVHALVVGGEALFAETVAQWEKVAADASVVVNEYGPTETVVGCAVYRAERGEARSGAVPIGRPIANTELYVLDARLRPVPVGVPGELYIGGVGVARGYWNRPELTAEKFVANPFSEEPGSRLYRTGDIVQYRSDGNLEFLGRADDQVKVRGYRIELGEIESAIADHPMVRECAVLAREDGPGDRRLVAYVVLAPGADLAPAKLRESVAERLPAYMVPAIVVALPELPLTVNGKVDRAALPVPDAARPELAQAYAAPETPAEQTLARIWCELLRLDKVGVHDSFFEIGGDSIVAIQMVSRASKAGLRLTPHQVFQLRTVAALARAAEQTSPVREAHQAASGEVPLTPIQRWFFERDQPAPEHYNQAALLHLGEHVDATLLEQALAAMVARHDAFRLRFVRTASGVTQRYDEVSPPWKLERWDLSALGDEDQVAEMDRRATALHRTLSLEAGPLVRAVWVDGSRNGKKLLIVIHHAVVDGVSWRILMEDIAQAYDELARGERPSRSPASDSFQRWATGLSAYASSPALLEQRDYWRRQALAVDGWPLEDAGDGDRVGNESRVVVELGAGETKQLLQRVPKAYGTNVQEALVAALGEALFGWVSGDRVCINLEGHGREEHVIGDVDVSRTVGWFTSMYPVVLERQPDGVGENLRWVKEVLRSVPDRGLGYGVLRYLAQDEELRSAANAPLTFNYLGQLDGMSTSLGTVSLTTGATGRWQSERHHRREAISVDAWVEEERLVARWTFGRRVSRADIERLAGAFVDALGRIVEHCAKDGVGGYTPADFEQAGLSQSELDELLTRMALRERGKVEDIYPLSPMQQGMLFHSLYSPSSGMYYEQMSLTLTGALDPEALVEAWSQTVRRHAALRTTFAWDGLRSPLQIVHRDMQGRVEVHDLRGRLPAEQSAAFEALLAERRREGFSLAGGPLFCVDLVQIADAESRFVLGFHHLLLDGWSMAQVFADTFSYYRAIAANEPKPAATTMPYSEFIAWQRRQDGARAEAYWRRALAGFTAPTPLFWDKSASVGETTGPKRQLLLERGLGRELTSAISEFSRRSGVTVATVFQGAWALLLSRYSGESDVVFGVVTSGRPTELANVETAVGLFINTLPVRARVAQDERLDAWLSTLQNTNAELRQFEYSSLAAVQAWSDVPKETPLFDSLFIFENYPMDAFVRDMDGPVKVCHVEAWEVTNYSLDVAVVPRGDELAVRLNYDPSRFSEAAVSRADT
ncbi:MAG TPA: amino acid adenylation domain-containing protein, partial [Labilithrix sp.]|nr:amino acid adenylation domain-containing protein [Labilithrix sp.]